MAGTRQATLIDLSGQWKYALDAQDRGEPEGWYHSPGLGSPTPGVLKLPGTLTIHGIGHMQEWSEEMNEETVRSLRQRYSYYGAAWYECELYVPENGPDKHLNLFLERVMFESKLWVNGQYAGRQDSLSVPHEFDVSALIHAGSWNRLTLRIDNRDIHRLGNSPSAYTEETQSIWNGIVGRMELQIGEPVRFTDLQIYAETGLRSVRVTCIVHNVTGANIHTELSLSASPIHGEVKQEASQIIEQKIQLQIPAASTKALEWVYSIGEEPLLWDEFNPNLYELKIEGHFIHNGRQIELTAKETFGLRSFQSNGRMLEINGRPLFLRGTLECCIFPLTGHPPMDQETWFNLLGTVQAYGLNHIRFHSWCPPESAFVAADRLGVYLQIECPMWMDTWNMPVGTYPEHYTYLPLEAQRIIQTYGNQPSFCIYSNGNELNGDFSLLHHMVADLKAWDNRRLYTLTTNWDRPLDSADDLFCAQTVDGIGARGQYFLMDLATSTQLDFREAILRRPVPVITHELGQYTVYPNAEEIELYRGALRPVNLEVIRADLDKRGLLKDIGKFVYGSGMLALQLYREEIEAALRTPELGGFQLLDLHDFPGQSTATVGILNAFWQSKGLIQPEQFREFCSPTVLLLRMPKRVYTNNEIFAAEVNIAHFGTNEIPPSCIHWTIRDGEGTVLQHSIIETEQIPFGAGIALGQLATDVLKQVKTSDRLTITLELAGTGIRNEWPIWVFPQPEAESFPHLDITVASTLDDHLMNKLEEGASVLFLIKNNDLEHTAPGKFHPVFWSPVHFATENPCGITVNAAHPVFEISPTQEYAEYQWYDLLENSTSLIISEAIPFNPVVQVIPNFYHNRKLTNLTEYTVGAGKLLICGINIEDDLGNRPAAAQLRRSIIQYMSSSAFAPAISLNSDMLYEMLKKRID